MRSQQQQRLLLLLLPYNYNTRSLLRRDTTAMTMRMRRCLCGRRTTTTTTRTTTTVTIAPKLQQLRNPSRSLSLLSSSFATTTKKTTPDVQEYDIVICGGGVVGAALVNQLLLLQQQQPPPHNDGGASSSGLRIALVESTPGPSPPILNSTTTNTNHHHHHPPSNPPPPPPHPRSYAVSPASLQLLFGSNGGSNDNDASSSSSFTFMGRGYYTRLQVWEAQQPAALLWTTNDLLPPDPKIDRVLGWCIEDLHLQQYLWYHKLQWPGPSPSTTTSRRDDDDDHDGNTTVPSLVHHHHHHHPNNNLTIHPSTVVGDIQWPTNNNTHPDRDTTWVTGTLTTSTNNNNNNNTTTTTTTTTTTAKVPFRTRLMIAADGSRSPLRSAAQIEMTTFAYQQTALTCTVQYPTTTTTGTTKSSHHSQHYDHCRHHCAYQRYLPNGSVLALLPTRDITNYGVIVYSTSTDEAHYWKERAFSTTTTTGHDEFVAYLNHMLQTGPERLPSFPSRSPPSHHDDDPSIVRRMATNLWYGLEQVAHTVQYGMSMAATQQPSLHDHHESATVQFQAPPLIERIVSDAFTYPLTCQIPKEQQYVRGNYLALVGDAAHTVHPMAGQGLNLGLQDVAALSRVILKAKNSGMDVGTYLHEYNTSRQIQVSTTVAGIHGLQQLFCSRPMNGVVGKHLKALGMNCVQNIKPLRQAMVRAACYGV